MEFEPEFPKSYKKGMKKFAIIFPNKIYGGVYSLGPLIVYNIVNSMENWICDRFFEDYLGNLENYDIIAFSISWILDYRRAKKIKEKFNLKDKIVVAGGPAVLINPNLFKKDFDALFLFEAETILEDILKVYEETKDKESFLESISEFDGVIVPGIKEDTKILRVKDLDKAIYPLYQPLPKEIDKRYVFGKVFLLEVARGCPFGCKFCNIPNLYSPYRIRSYNRLLEIVEEGYRINKRKKIVIYAPILVHPKLKDFLKYLIDNGFEFSLPSLRPEFVDEELIDLMYKGGQRTLTLAPETGDEKIRFSIGKNIKDSEFLRVAEIARNKMKEIKLYFIIGLPDQDIEDAYRIVDLSKKIREKFGGEVYVSINPFVPVRFSEYENEKFDLKKVKEMKKIVVKGLKKEKFRFSIKSLKISYMEYKLNKYKG